MGGTRSQAQSVWALARRQHGVVSRAQLQERGLGRHEIEHRLRTGRLHRVRKGVYAVGRPELTGRGRWMAAVLACGSQAVVSHETALALWGLGPDRGSMIHVSVPAQFDRRPPGVAVHRPGRLEPSDVTLRQRIPVTTPARTLIDLAAVLPARHVEAAVNAADKLDLLTPDRLRAELDRRPGQRGVGRLRRLLDRRTFRLTDSELERRFLRLVRSAGLPVPETGGWLNGFKVDFHWPGLGLVVETDGLRYHRTPAEQARDLLRDQAHTMAGLTCLRFTHAQVRYEPDAVRGTLAAVARRLA
jgi:very-short-patch-repair endonuclease